MEKSAPKRILQRELENARQISFEVAVRVRELSIECKCSNGTHCKDSDYFFMSPQKRAESFGKGRRIKTIKLGHPMRGAPTLLSYLLFKGV